MSLDYGKKISKALEAVRRLHADTSKLLQDCDGSIGKGKKSFFGSNATQDLTYNAKALFWMAEGVFRYYHDEHGPEPGLVDGVTVSFFDLENRIDEPVLVVGRLFYRPAEDRPVCKGWDLWHAFYGLSDRKFDVVLSGESVDDSRILSSKVIAVPLYSVQSLKAVTDLMERVRATA